MMNGGGPPLRTEIGGKTREVYQRLFIWGRCVTVEKPASLRRELAEMRAGLAGHHGGPLWTRG